MPTSRPLLSLAAGLTLVALVSASDGPTLERRLDRLAESLEAARVEARVPGMSIAIVKDDEVVWARGFGLADVAAERPADESTIYAIGSTTKAFTATLVGMLVDEGQASWDDPVTDYLPYFDLQVRSDDADAECTLRDLLSHRHGFSRMGILWFGGDVPRDEVLRTAAAAEPWDDFRKAFHYCNVTYLAAGEAASVAAGSTWDELMVERIFEPLAMTASTLSTPEAQKDPRLALGYEWDESGEQFEHKRMIDLENVGPAGSVNSNVIDMAQWLRLQLGRGEVDGERLISAERILETWEPQIEMGKGAFYGLGWMLREHDGHKVVEHGGNIDGFSAQVSLMPEKNLGYVLLMNRSAAPLRESSLALVFDALLDDDGPGENASASAEPAEIDLEDYAGLYVANFAKFRDEEFEVLVNGDRLAIDVPGQLSSDLEHPDAEGRWVSVLTDKVAVSFQRDDQGGVVSLTMHTNGFHFEVPRKGLEVQFDAAAPELEKYVGTYVRAEGGKRVQLSIGRGRLAMEDKGNLLEFHAPDAEGRAPLRARADYGATFKTDAEGNVQSFVFRGSAGEKLFTRLADAHVDLPTLDEVLTLRETDARVAAMEAGRGTRITGKVWIAHAGVRGTLTIETQGSDRYASHMDFGKFGRIDAVARGDAAWSYNSMRGFRALKGKDLAQALLEHPGAVDGDWTDYFDSVEVVRNDTVGERAAHVVRLEVAGLPSRTYWIDAEHGDVLQVKMIAIEGSVSIPVTITYSGFEESGGIRAPRRVELENPESGRMVLTFDTVESGLDLGDDAFTLEDPDAE